MNVDVLERVCDSLDINHYAKYMDPAKVDRYGTRWIQVKSFGKYLPKINKILRYIQELPELEWNPSGSIHSNATKYLDGAYYIEPEYHKKTGQLLRIKAYVYIGKLYKFCFGSPENEDGITGYEAFKEFKKLCSKHGINLDDERYDSTEQDKEDIESPYIMFFDKYHMVETGGDTVPNCHHLDINSAWPSRCCEAYPELTPVFKELKAKSKYYANAALGYCQSEYCNYKYSKLAKEGIKRTNDYLNLLTAKLIRAGRTVVGYNTDGIWYQGDVYHDEDEGTEFGQWKTDYTNCHLVIYGNGDYGIWENDGEGAFHVKMRGRCQYDYIKDRSKWDPYDYIAAHDYCSSLRFNEETKQLEWF